MTPETRALIESDADEYAAKVNRERQILITYDHYIAGATPYAEKWEAAVEENARINTEHNHLISEWEILKAKKDQFEQENKRLQEENETLRCQKDSCYRDYDFLYNENKRMRKALEYLAIFNRPGGATTYEAVRNAATEALKPKQ